MIDVVIISLIVLFTVPLLFAFFLCYYDKKNRTSHSCRLFGWHNGVGSLAGFDGASSTSTCGKCGVKVLQDSQGNWFRASKRK